MFLNPCCALHVEVYVWKGGGDPENRQRARTASWMCFEDADARSAKFWMSANTRTLVSAPFHKFLVPYQGFFFSFLSI